MTKWERDCILILEESVRNFQSKMLELSAKEYYLVGSLVINKKMISWFPPKFVNEYAALMMRAKSVVDKEDR